MAKKPNKKTKAFYAGLWAAVLTASLSLTGSAVQLSEPAQAAAGSGGTAQVIPFFRKTEMSAPKELIPLGIPVGIKIYSNGIMVAGISGVETPDGSKSPAEAAGLKKGDIIVAIEGKPINTGEELEQAINKCEGKDLTFSILRDGKSLTLKICPEKSETDGNYRIGAWVRDSMAGIGTISFVDPRNGSFGALGHAICDVDSGNLMPLRSGSIMPAVVTDVKKGEAGLPGELQGAFDLKRDIGTLTYNTGSGIFGVMTDKSVYSGHKAVPIATSSEVKPGKATILSTVEGKEPVAYNVEILRINDRESEEKNLLLKVTDERLLARTGGIVQGMSGSPILQNGKLVGAVTHVLVNDPQKGYGVFIENMLQNAVDVPSQKIA